MVDVLVVGAGPTGLALACGLLAQGVGVRLVERVQAPSDTSRANILHARGVETLDRLDALADLPDRSVRALRITSYISGRPALVLRFGDTSFRTTGGALLVSQAEVERILRERLAKLGGMIEWGAELKTVVQDQAGVTATLADGSTIRSRWLVGCDGAHSRTRKLAGIEFPGERLADRWLIADVHACWDGADRQGTSSWLHPDGLAAALAMREVAGGRHDLWRMMLYLPGERNEGEELGHDEILERFRALMPERSGIRDMVIADAVWASDFQIHQRLVDTYRVGRILLAGDAAHIHSPLGGQGMLTGIGDAENLAWKLALVALGRAGVGLLDTYEAERRPLAERIQAGTRRNTRMATREGRWANVLLERVIVPVTRLPSVQRWGTWQASQLWLTYRSGPLGGSRFGRKPRPGDRVPDLRCARSDGTETRLYAELRGRWAQIGQVPLPARLHKALAPLVVRLERSGHEPMLVRPDGHLAWRGSEGRRTLEAQADRMLGR